MRAGLLSRLERLESRTAAVTSGPLKVRFGDLRRLPPDYKGEKHIVVAQELPSRNGQEWVEFEEVPGPDPNLQKRTAGDPNRLDVMFVSRHASELEAIQRFDAEVTNRQRAEIDTDNRG